MSSYWLVELKGDKKSLKFLQDFLQSEELSVIEDQEAVCLKVTNLENKDNSTPLGNLKNFENSQYLENLVERINGAVILLWPNFTKVNFHKIIKVDDDGSRLEYRTLHASLQDRTLYSFNSEDKTLVQWISLSEKDAFINKAFYLYSALELNWSGLYMILEVVSDDLRSWDAIIKRGWASKENLRLFKHTANSYGAVGRYARHASIKHQQPQNPMTIHAAKSLVKSILVQWISSKLSNA